MKNFLEDIWRDVKITWDDGIFGKISMIFFSGIIIAILSFVSYFTFVEIDSHFNNSKINETVVITNKKITPYHYIVTYTIIPQFIYIPDTYSITIKIKNNRTSTIDISKDFYDKVNINNKINVTYHNAILSNKFYIDKINN